MPGRNTCLGFRDPETLVPYTMGNLEIMWERGLKGRFHKYFGDDLNATFQSQSMGIRFAAFACAKSTYSGPIDVIMKDDDHNVKVVGELRVPWVPEHSIEDRLEFGSDLKKTLALPILYMQQLWCVYGFLSTYDETIFLRQVVGSQGVWWIKYSPVILASITYDKGDAKDYLVVSTKQCFFYMGCEALNQGPVNNTTAGWVQRH